MEEVLIFCTSGKKMGAPTGNWLYDSAREITEIASMQLAANGLRNPYTYQRLKITPLPNETALTVPGGTGVAVVPNGTALAVKATIPSGAVYRISGSGAGMGTAGFAGRGSGIEGGSDALQIGKTDLDEIWAGRNIKSPGNNPLFTRHAEEVLANDFDRAVIEAGINPQDVSGVLKIHQSNPTGGVGNAYKV